MTDETKKRIIENAKSKLMEALRDGLDSGLTYEDICTTIAKTINTYKEEKGVIK